jgi:hypothetical protein
LMALWEGHQHRPCNTAGLLNKPREGIKNAARLEATQVLASVLIGAGNLCRNFPLSE